MKAPLPADEATRLEALRKYNILDTLPEQDFDDLTLLAALICNAPIAFIGFIDADRQWFKSKVGMAIQETPRYISFCAHAIVEPDVCIIRDALADERFATNPLVNSDPHIRFYASAQLVTPEGHAIGTLCVIDHVPRDLSSEQEESLRGLARQVMAQLELRRHVADLEHIISENKRAEEEIRFQASLLDAVEESVIATDLGGKIIYWNRFAEKMYGWPSAEVIGRNITEITPSEISQDAAAEIMSRLRHGESWSGEFIVRRRDSSGFPAMVTDSPIYDSNGVLIGIVGISTDITNRKQAEEALRQAHEELERRVAQRTTELTSANAFLTAEIAERKLAEEALRESEERFRLLIEGIKDYAIFTLDTEGRISSWNEGAARLKGYSPEEIIGQHFSICRTPEDSAQGKPEQALQIATAEGHFEDECWLVRKDGSRFWANVIITAVRGAEGDLRGFAEITRDITDRREAERERVKLLLRLITVQEEERQRLARELHDQLGQHLPALQIGLKSLEDINDLRTVKEKLRPLQDIIKQLAQQSHVIARDLRPTALDDIGLQAALSNYVEEWSERSGVTVDFHSNGLLERLQPEIETTIYRVVQEALTNVLKHAQAQTVSLIVEHRHGLLRAIIEDDGKGFDLKAVQNAPVTRRRLGLLGMQERVALVGGKLEIESTPGVGTTIAVRIPTSFDEQGGGRP